MAETAPYQKYRKPIVLRPSKSGRTTDALIAVALASATFLVHSVHYLLTAPFWLDESWVAVSTRLPVRDIPHVTASTPAGWTTILRTFAVGGPQALRLLPLAFSALSVVVAFLLARSVPLGSKAWNRVAATLAGIAVLLAPSSLVRNDLKQYTADAFVTLTVLLLICRLEASWSRRRLAHLSAVCIVGFLFSAAALFVATAGFAVLLAVQLARHNRRRAIDVCVSGVIAVGGLGAVFLALYKPHVQENLTQYWRAFYPPVSKGLGPTIGFLHTRGNQMASFLGMGPLPVALLLVAAGVVTVARSGRPVLAYTAPMLLVEMFVVGAARKYPLFDERTSHFLTVTLAVFAAIGIAGLGSLLARRHVLAAATLVVVAVASFTFGVRHDVRKRTIFAEDVRTAAEFVSANQRPTDIIVVSALADWAFGYYWPKGRPSWRPSPESATGFQAWFPEQPRIIIAKDRDQRSVQSALSTANNLANSTPGARIWIVRMHVRRAEDKLWLAGLKLQQRHVQTPIPCALVLLTPIPSGSPENLPDTGDLRSASCY